MRAAVERRARAEIAMKKRKPLHLDALQAGVVRKLAQHACADLCEPALLRRGDDMLARARVIHAALSTRRRFEALYERSRELQTALERFKARRTQIHGA
jgi:hypothetical protein